MFDPLLESARPATIPTRLAAVSLAVHASALVLAISLLRPVAPRVALPAHRAEPMIYVVHQAARPMTGATTQLRGAGIPDASMPPAWVPSSALPQRLELPGSVPVSGSDGTPPDLESLLRPGGSDRIGGQRILDDATAPPELVHAVSPQYPPSLVSAGVTGRVIVEFVVDSAGQFVESTLRIIATDHPAFVEPARLCLRQSRFRAARAGGSPVAAWVRQSVRFSLVSAPR